METLDDRAEAAVRSGLDWMRAHEKDVCLLGTMDHFGAEFSPHGRMPEIEDAAHRFGLHIVYADAEAKSIMGEEPIYYVLLSKEDSLTEDEIELLLPGFHPVHHWHEGLYRAAA